jgi:hypothetical protein
LVLPSCSIVVADEEAAVSAGGSLLMLLAGGGRSEGGSGGGGGGGLNCRFASLSLPSLSRRRITFRPLPAMMMPPPPRAKTATGSSELSSDMIEAELAGDM